MAMKVYTQGPLRLHRVPSLSHYRRMKEIPRSSQGRIEIAQSGGWTTPHSIKSRSARFLEPTREALRDGDDMVFILVVFRPVILRHPGHDSVRIEPGTYEVTTS